MGQFDENEDPEDDKKCEAQKMYLLKTSLIFLPVLHPVPDIGEETGDRHDAAANATCYQQMEIHVRCAWWK